MAPEGASGGRAASSGVKAPWTFTVALDALGDRAMKRRTPPSGRPGASSEPERDEASPDGTDHAPPAAASADEVRHAAPLPHPYELHFTSNHAVESASGVWNALDAVEAIPFEPVAVTAAV